MNSKSNYEYTYIYVAYITLKNGKRLYARNYGKRAFRIRVKKQNNFEGLWWFALLFIFIIDLLQNIMTLQLIILSIYDIIKLMTNDPAAVGANMKYFISVI